MNSILTTIVCIFSLIGVISIILSVLKRKSHISNAEKQVIRDELKIHYNTLENIDEKLKNNKNTKINSINELIDSLP